ncbi:MAG: glycerol-3-phosphate acyltransferase PlsY [Salibacteraceae bacterium]|jgi:glycerol-3-phosphate acyltransferase PlsY
MQTTEVILVLFLVWQLSAMPIPVWMASAFFGVDAEDYNSKPGWAENKFSFESNKWSLTVFFAEFVKGLGAMLLLQLVANHEVLLFEILPLQYILAFVVIIGHTFPVYNEFKPTHSMGAYFGVFAALWLVPALLALGVFFVFWAVSKKVTISSLMLSLGLLVIITFILIDINALAIASALSALLLVSVLKQKIGVVRA